MNRRALFIAGAKTGPELRAGASDCQKIYNILIQERFGGFETDLSAPLLTDCATSGDYFAALNDFMTRSAGATQRIIYFTGHGRVSHGAYGFVFGSDFLPFSVVTGMLQGHGPARTLVILDTCHSGAADLGGVKTDAFQIHAAGSALFASSREVQLSHEDPELGSLFTNYLCECIESGNGGARTTRGLITIPEATEYIKRRITEDGKSPQDPIYNIKNADGHLWIARNISGSANDAIAPVAPDVASDRLSGPCSNATLEELDADLLTTYARDNLGGELTTIDAIVEELDLCFPARQGIPSKAAVLCFGRKPSRYFPNAASVFSAGDRAADALTRSQVDGPLLRQLQELVQLTTRELRTTAHIDADQVRIDVPEIPVSILREVIANALAHRDFEGDGRVHVHVDADHVLVSNPGSAPKGHSWDDLLDAPGLSLTPNRRLANLLQAVGGHEGVGRGFSILHNYRKERGEDAVSLTQQGGIVKCELRRPPAQLTTDEGQEITKPSNLPGSIGHLFKGREEFLDRLRESFRHNAATAITGKAVHGLGGVGKTRTAIEYGHARAADYTATLFLIGKSENDLRDSLAALAGATVLDLPEKDAPDLDARVAAVIRWLRTNPGWLLIIDNVDDEPAARAVRAFLDQVSLGGGHVLITSRVSDWGHMVEPLELDLLSVDAAKDLLSESTPRRTKRADEDAALTRLADEQLGCLSLALVQAAAYIDERRIAFSDYATLFEKEANTLLARLGESAVHNISYPLPVALTWQASFARLSDAGRLLLDMLAWLSIEPIPRTLFALWPQAETVDLDEGLAELTRYSFVHWEAENSAIALQRLVAQVTRDNLDEAGRDRALGALYPWLNAVNPGMSASDVRCWPQLLPLLPHALMLFERTSDCGPYPGQTDLYNEYAILLQSLARYSEAEPLFRSALAIDEASHGSDHPEVATDLNNLAGLLRATDRLAEAEPLYRRALAINEASYGPDHPTVATRLNNLAGLLRDTNRLVEAEPLYRRALAINEATYDPDHPTVATRLNNLADLLQATSRLAEAEPLYRRALAIDEANYGPDHPRMATHLNNLAMLLRDTNRLAEVEPLLRRALAIDEASYGPDHPEVATDLNNLAALLRATDGLAEAEPLYRRAALILLRSSKASGHLLPNTALAFRNYASALIEAGREPDDVSATIASNMTEAGFDPAELWPQVFGDDG